MNRIATDRPPWPAFPGRGSRRLISSWLGTCGLTFPSTWGELLINIGDPRGELFGLPTAWGDPAVLSLQVPNDPLLAGFVIFTQAASFGGSICLHCAHECIVGY